MEERAEITRLGRGIGSGGGLGGDAIARTLGVWGNSRPSRAARCRAAIGTEALRRAPNADEFLRPAAQILGTQVG